MRSRHTGNLLTHDRYLGTDTRQSAHEIVADM